MTKKSTNTDKPGTDRSEKKMADGNDDMGRQGDTAQSQSITRDRESAQNQSATAGREGEHTERPGRLVLIDSYGLIYRAFFALPPLSNSKGQATHAALGFTHMLMRIISEEKPTYLIAAFDKGRPEHRMEMYAEYKAHREEMPDDLRSQIPLVRRVLEAYNIPILEVEGQEADDVIATLAHKAEGAHEVRIITGDLDLLQLVDDRTSIVVTKRGIAELQRYDPAAVRERYNLDPLQLPDYRGLKGDPSDNLPGIPGIGEKTASKLIAVAGSLDALLADPTLAGTPKLEKLIREHGAMARMCRDMSTVDRTLDVDVPWDEATYAPPSTKALAALFRELEFKQLLAKLDPNELLPSGRKASGAASSGTGNGGVNAGGTSDAETGNDGEFAVEIIAGEYTTLPFDGGDESRAAILSEIAALAKHDRLLVIRTEDEIGVAWEAGKAIAMPLSALDDAVIREAFCDVLRSVPNFAAHDAKSLFSAFRARGAFAAAPTNPGQTRSRKVSAAQGGLFDAASADATPQAAVPVDKLNTKLAFPPRAIADDSMIAAYLLEPSRPYVKIADAVQDVLGAAVPAGSAAAAADAAWRVVVKAREILTERGQLPLYDDIELPAAMVLAQMEANGIALDRNELQTLSVDIDADVERKRAEIYAMAGEEFNIGSPQQLGRILFDKLEIPGGKKNKTGYATGIEVLAGLRETYPIAATVLEYREVTKLKNTYVDVLPTLMDADGRLRTVFNQTTTATGRLSSVNPNLQNIPVRGELGRRIRKAFIAGGKGRVLLAADYSQIELRLMAHLSGDEAMRKAFNDGHDIHDETARKIFGVREGAEVDHEQRRLAKSVNFGLLYGMGEFGLAQRLGLKRDEARGLIESYFGQFPGVRGYLDGTIAFGKEHGYVETIAGRRRYLPDLRSRDHMARAAAEREATNAPLQGGAADLVKIAMNRVARALDGLDAELLLQIHDELMLEVAEPDLRKIVPIVRNEMASAMQLAVPLEVTVKTGGAWYDIAAYDDEVADELQGSPT